MSWLARICIVVSFSLLAISLGTKILSGAPFSLIIGGIWLVNSWRAKWSWLSSASFVVIVALAVVAALYGPKALAPIALILALFGWDLDLFSKRLEKFQKVEGDLELNHLKRLLIMSTISLILVAIALIAQFKLSFGIALAISLVGLASLIAILRLAGGLAKP